MEKVNFDEQKPTEQSKPVEQTKRKYMALTKAELEDLLETYRTGYNKSRQIDSELLDKMTEIERELQHRKSYS